MAPELRTLLFSRYPVPGEVKTRLIPQFGAAQAAQVHRRMAEHAVSEALSVQGAETVIHYTGSSRKDFQSWLGPRPQYRKQVQGDLGNRLEAALGKSFKENGSPTIAVGTDIPALSAGLLSHAFQALADNDVVIGPAEDGGYYLIGMNSPRPELFRRIEWGSSRVFSQTLERIKSLGLTFRVMPALNDVDRPEDLDPLRSDPRFADIFSGKALISVVIPSLNEESLIGSAVRDLLRSEAVEVIVADGGSRDGTREAAENEGALVLHIPGGRALQQNAGAGKAGGRILFFQHADTRLPADWASHVRAALEDPAVSAGAFSFRTDGAGFLMRLVEAGANVRSRILGFPYGDQGLFLEKRIFDEVGGFEELPIMEDFQLVRCLRRRGRVVTLSQGAVTSSRRWKSLGVFRTFARNQVMIAGFLAGVRPEKLAGYYRGRTRDESQPVK